YVRAGTAVHVLSGDVAFEDVLEMRWHRAVYVEEMCHVYDVVDDLTAVCLDDRCVPVPFGPLVTGRTLDPRNGHLGWRRIAFRVVPHEQHSVLLQRVPLRGAGQFGHPLAIGHTLAPAVAAPAPIVERACDLISLHLALGEIAAHVTAVSVERVDLAVATSEYHQLLPECVDGMRLAVAELFGQTQAVPAASESGRGRPGFDLPNLVSSELQRHVVVVQPTACSWRRVSRWQGNAPTTPIPRPTVIFVTSAQSATIPAGIPVCDTVVDLLVVGSGTGLAAALAAQECGLSVLIVEKSSYVGGSTARSGGALWLPASPILAANGAGDTVERAETYLQSVVADTAPAERSAGYLRNVTGTVELLQRTTPIRLSWAKDYSDYHPEAAGGTAAGRTCECRPLNSAVLGKHRTRLRPGVMEVKIPMPTTTADYRWMNLVARIPRKGLPTIAKRLAQGVGGLL